MTGALTDLAGVAETWLVLGFVVFLRVGAAMAVLPAFGERMVPMRIRFGLALAFTAVVLPAVALELLDDGFSPIFWFSEPLAGLALGIGLRLFVIALQTAGSIAAQATSLAQLLGGAAVEPAPAISHVLVVAALALAVAAGLHIKIVMLFMYSYQLFPVGAFPLANDFTAWGLDQIASSFALAFMLSAPFIIGSLVYNLALGVINRAMPQLMVAFVGAPAITAGALLLMLLSAPLMLEVWQGRFDAFLFNPIGKN